MGTVHRRGGPGGRPKEYRDESICLCSEAFWRA
jgi:hypothetical protein